MDARLTRDDDRYLKLNTRTTLANRWDADAFVSVHLNALPKGRHAKGVEIYIMALPTDKDAMALAKIENAEIVNGSNGNGGDKTDILLSILGDMQQNNKIQESTSFAEALFASGKGGGLPMRRVAQAPFYVLRGAAMPAVLVETGFISEKSEARLLANPSYQEKLAKALAKGIAAYLK
jgi:N-acetylmuramoyl-L-alanine amidase